MERSTGDIMRNRLSIGVAALLLAIIAAGPAAAKPSRLVAFAARQDLRDMVCIAIADGRISAQERIIILIDAKKILYPEEYRIFKRAFNRVSPPPKKRVARRPVKIARKQPPPKPQPTAPPKPQPQAEPSSGPSLGPVIPAGAVLPDRMASIGPVRKQPVPKPRPTTKPAAEPSLGPVIPAGAILPDRMASFSPVR